VDAHGTSFAVYSSVADAVELCLFDADGEETRLELSESSGFVWHGHVAGVGAGQRYGYRVHGPWHPAAGLRCNPNKLLLDPYARAIAGRVQWGDAILGHTPGLRTRMNRLDSAASVPRSVVVDSRFDWGAEDRPCHPDGEQVIYETHVKGISQRHPAVPPELRGTYAGLAHPAVIEHLVDLGVTTVELLPVQQFVHDGFLLDRGLRNYWGYNTIGFFAPHAEYAAADPRGGQVDEFKAMVRALHAAGLEVILDVVYNHTGEGSHRGPTLAFRGFDNGTYYRLREGDPSRYADYTGTGNTLDATEPFVLQLIADSLRYWITEMHVDGFRFDLATALGRESDGFDRHGGFFDVLQQDPVIRTVRLIAEPWDVGHGGYRIGQFPPYFAEWNGRFRDDIRDLWRGQPDMLHDFGRRFTGSAGLFVDEGRGPTAGISFITAHDGFTLADLVSYERKHNLANGDGNRDGESHNRSWNCGAEGPTDDPAVLALRRRQRRSLLATLLLSQGVPMLLGGDEIGRSQGGNNNGYCQDNEVSWYDWGAVDKELLDFTRRLIAMRRAHPVFRRQHWFEPVDGHEPDQSGAVLAIEWCLPDGERMRDDQWHTDGAGAIGVRLSGEHLVDDAGQPIEDDAFYLALNATAETIAFRLPESAAGQPWSCVLDTGAVDPFEARNDAAFVAGEPFELVAHSLLLLRRPRHAGSEPIG
jgi:glycogen operon protein